MKTSSTRLARARLLAAAAVAANLWACGQSGPLVLPDRDPATAQAPQTEADTADDDEANRER
jgi:predicted small lipoprotein YifL